MTEMHAAELSARREVEPMPEKRSPHAAARKSGGTRAPREATPQAANGSLALDAVAPVLLDWYTRERRDLPWRMAPGKTADPYRVWLSEIMLQQTTVKAVIPYFEAFVRRWPTVDALANAERDEVLSLWAGLGYYSRANNLHACAQTVVAEHGGAFPADEAALRTLPGIGPYTAAAIASIAFGLKATPIDGNIERVVSRLMVIQTLLPGAKREIKPAAEAMTPLVGAGDFAQALMDLGARICTPKRPSCMICPLHRMCAAHAQGIAADLPRKAPKAERPVRNGTAFLALSDDGKVLLRRRHASGLLANMMEVPSTDWLEVGDTARRPAAEQPFTSSPVKADWQPMVGLVTHTFTHFKLELTVYRALVSSRAPLTLWAEPERCRWVARHDLADQALPSVMRKVLAHGLRDLT